MGSCRANNYPRTRLIGKGAEFEPVTAIHASVCQRPSTIYGGKRFLDDGFESLVGSWIAIRRSTIACSCVVGLGIPDDLQRAAIHFRISPAVGPRCMDLYTAASFAMGYVGMGLATSVNPR